MNVGDAVVTRVEEMIDTSFTAAGFFRPFEPAALRPHMEWLAPRYYIPERDALVFSMHAWVVKTGRHTVLVDTCIGDDKERMPRAHWHHLKTGFLDRLRKAGAAPEAVDYVMCTHMHADHVGWNTKLADGRWVPTFPKARYLFARVEYEHWQKNSDPSPLRRAAFADSVLPIVEAGRADMIEDGHEVDRALTVQLAPGHTPGNAASRRRGTKPFLPGTRCITPCRCSRSGGAPSRASIPPRRPSHAGGSSRRVWSATRYSCRDTLRRRTRLGSAPPATPSRCAGFSYPQRRLCRGGPSRPPSN
jgi:hypothetical protein